LRRGTLTESNETLTSEIYFLCDEAIKKIDDLIQKEREGIKNVRNEATKKKKEIVVELAEHLDKLIYQKDTISSTILKQLKGRVGKSLIHKCLPAKYKKEHRRKNALKQKNKIRNKINLAPLSALKQPECLQTDVEEKEEEKVKQKEKVAVMVGAYGRSITQIKEDKESSENESEDPNRHYINEQGDIHEKPRPLTDIENKAKITDEAFVEHSFENEKDILPFEFPINRKDIIDYLSTVDGDVLWINGIINKITKKIIHSFGRSVHQNVAEKSNRSNTATIDVTGDREN